MLTVNFLGDALTATCAMQVLHGMLVSRPKQESLPSELNAKIVSALYNCKPGRVLFYLIFIDSFYFI